MGAPETHPAAPLLGHGPRTSHLTAACMPGVPAGELLGTPSCVSGAADGVAGLDPEALGGAVFHWSPNCDPGGSGP